MTLFWDGKTERTPEDVRKMIFDRSSADNRRALLELHTRRTLAAASKALDNRWKWLGRYDAALILIAAAPRYVRLGGNLDPWGLGQTEDWDAKAAEDAWLPHEGRHLRSVR